MNKKLTLFLSVLIISVSFNNFYGQVKLAQTGLKFLSVSPDARASAIGDAVTSLIGNSSSMFYNPAAMSDQKNYLDATFNMTKWIADINYMHASASIVPSNGLYGVFGLSIASVDYGTFHKTRYLKAASGEDSYVDLGTYSPKSMAIGLGYAKALSDKFSIGGNVKYVYQNLGADHVIDINSATGKYTTTNFDINVLSFDFGLLYKTGFKSLNFGMSVRNFSQEIEYIEESFQLPLTFKLGLSMNVFDLFDFDSKKQKLNVAIDVLHPRDYNEQINIGCEYVFYDILSLRAGYISPTDEQGISAGIGLKKELAGILLGIDYAYLDFGILNDVHRFSVNISY
ncbi:MAG: DUF3308 domain-containing protein [Ignavibacteriae bacterium]|nr:MAG: DUF3308 domain-containing protein [Ignavibacteriota bacterium]